MCIRFTGVVSFSTDDDDDYGSTGVSTCRQCQYEGWLILNIKYFPEFNNHIYQMTPHLVVILYCHVLK